ncbi:Pullulanase [Saliniradius amylolyticus]|uniref:pullulanase n=1 Tax=Saliniradius amylolyticus TaxID=2183582 RepID=A0A2S2E1B2_9ALTE|nr:alpha-1,6-glucosidase domain-containing protein [Saliniradius amylolyticus]AWL11060.1 Pullulanase [Saliniradius amylolyticus]
MFFRQSMLKLFALAFLTLGLAACGGSDIESGEQLLTCDVPNVPNAAGTECVAPPPIECPAPTVPNETNDACVVGADPSLPEPTVFPGDNEAVLYYNRPQDASNESDDPVYEGYRLHTWNNDECDAYQAESIAPSWDNGLEYDGIDPNYGAYWILKLKDGVAGSEGACGNFIIHIGTDDAGKEMGGGDKKMPLAQDDPDFTRMNWALSGEPDVFEFPILSLGERPVAIEDMAAHWLDPDTLVWDVDTNEIASVKLHYSMDASLSVDPESETIAGESVEFTLDGLTDAQAAANPEVSSWPAFSALVEPEQAKSMLKSQLVAAGYDGDGELVQATYVQIPAILDYLYTAGEADADEAQLGLNYNGSDVTASVWAPTAQSVNLKVYDAAKSEVASHSMTEDPATGIWTYTGSDLDRQFYRYEVTVYHPASEALETLETTDPYSVSLATNGRYSQFVNLSDADLKPDNWDSHAIPAITNPEDAVIYEGHIRDFSILDESTPEAMRGKYLAFTAQDTAPVNHLKALQEAGLTHFHMLPANDIATVNENFERQLNLTSPLSELCLQDRQLDVCHDGAVNQDGTILEALETYPADSPEQQVVVNAIRDIDGFNWGYDPHHFNAPEGSYATDPDGVARIKEMRAMIQALHDMGLRVVTDVVYNHTNASALYQNSVFDKVVPGYYHRLDLVSGAVNRVTCCDDTASEHTMMGKFVKDSVAMWAEQYKLDGFRWDLMAHIPKDVLLATRDAVHQIDPDNYFYGEGWNIPDYGFEQSNQTNLAGTEIGTFNDRYRDIIRDGVLFNPDGSLQEQDIIRLGLAGTLADFALLSSSGSVGSGKNFFKSSYAQDPADVINYVSKHDNETLWDKLQYAFFNMENDDGEFFTLQEKVRAQHIASTIPMFSQGVPFLQMGGDLIRSKSMDRNSYDSGDWFNRLDFTMQSNNFGVGLPLEQDNGGNWETIGEILGDSNAQVSSSDIMFASDLFKETLQIRSGSPLFRLTTAQDVFDRVGFHNIGTNQKQGLIVMSIDDGSGLTDLDPNHDAIVVVFNGSRQEQSHTIATATGFELHPMQQMSVDSMVAGASFAEGEGEGTFTVPALTTAVFVKPQSGAQGEGLSATATQGAPDVVPYADTTAYIRGDMNGWSTDDAMTYEGNGVYEVTLSLTGGTTYNFKFASEDWSTINYGDTNGEGTVVEEDPYAMSYNTGNLMFTPEVDGDYVFSVNASDAENPVLTVRNDEPYVGTTVYLRGDMNGWSTDDAFSFIGDGQYEIAVTLDAGTYGFKVASEDWATVNYGEGEVMVGDTDLSTVYNGGNFSITIEDAGDYRFVFDASDKQAPTLSVGPSELFGENTVLIRGSLNGWGEDDPLNWVSPGTYAVTMTLAAGDYEFKFATADWSTVNIGALSEADSDVTVNIGQALPLNHAANPPNLKLSIVEGGDYRFSLSGFNWQTPELTVNRMN